MTIVDTHCHIGLSKYEPVESLLFHMARSGVARAVLIQYMGNADNTYLLETMSSHPGRFSAAMIVEETDDGTKMREWHERGIPGIRLPVDARARGADPLAHWRTAAELGLVVSAPSSPQGILSLEFDEVLRTFPELSIAIEHLGGIGPGCPDRAFAPVTRLAEHPNVTIKLPGFGEFCEPPHPFAHIPPFADMVLEAFGPKRIMWGSDFPPVSTREGYDNALAFPQRYFSALSEDERSWIFGGTALRVWKFVEA